MKKFFGVFCGVLLIFSIVGSASAITYSISNGLTSQTIEPLANSESAAAYYDYAYLGSASGNPDFGPVDDTAFFWLYKDTNTSVLSLGMIFDNYNPSGSGTNGAMNLSTSGMPGGATVAVSDDSGETSSLINGTEAWAWNYNNSDGAMVSGLENSLWSIDIVFNSFSGLEGGFFFLNGPDSSLPSAILLSPCEDLTIKAESVPEPATMFLFGFGLLGLAGFRRRFRKN